MQAMDSHECVVFEGFGTRDPPKTQPHQDEIMANWANVLVDEVFNDPDCERLQVSSIIHAIREMGFPEEYSTKVIKLEQQLDPKNEGLIVDKPRLRHVVERWLRCCNEEKDADDPFEADLNVSVVHFNNNDANSSVDIHLKKDDGYKNEMSILLGDLHAYEDKVKTLQLEIDGLRKSMKILQKTLQKTEEDKVHAEESKATIEERLQAEKSRRNKEVSTLEKHLVLAKDQIVILAKENDELSTSNLGLNRTIKDLRDELVTKCTELEELVQERGVLTTCLEQQEKKLTQAERERRQLENANFDLTEHAKEWKKNIQDLKAEKDVISKKFLVLSSRLKNREEKPSISSDFGSDSSNIAELSIFSPDFFSSPVASKKLSIELVESQAQEATTMESTKRISRTRPANKSTDGPIQLKQNVMRKRKLFDVPDIESSVQKRFRVIDVQRTTSTVGPSLTVALPWERSTSFAINLTPQQKLVEALRQTLCLHPHLFGCIRDFVAGHIDNSITTGSEALDTNLTTLFYEFCMNELIGPFRGRQFLRAIGEEMPAPTDAGAMGAHHSSHVLQLESNVTSEVLPPDTMDGDGKEGSTEIYHEILVTENSANELIPSVEVCVSELENNAVQTSSYSGNRIEEISSRSDAAGIDDDGSNNEINHETSDLELCSNGLSADRSKLTLPVFMGCEKTNESEQKVSAHLASVDATSLVMLRSCAANNDDDTDVDIVENEGLHVTDLIRDDANENIDGSCDVITDSSPTSVSANVEELGADITTNSDESDIEFQSLAVPYFETPVELPDDLNLDVDDNPDGDRSFYGTPLQSPAARNVMRPYDGPPLPPGGAGNRVNRSGRSATCRCFCFMLKFLIFFLLPFLFFLFFSLILALKVILTDEEYVEFLLALGGTYHPAEHPLY